MRKAGISFLVVLFLVIAGPFSSRGEELDPSQLYAHSACLMDGESGRVLYGKNEMEKLPMASTTKIMTCILALEHGHMNEVVEVSQKAASQPKVHMGAAVGEKFLLNDLLYGMMLNSYNDAAVMIAEHIGGDTEAFAQMMNKKARELGCEDTYFITANGLDGEDQQGIHSTTAKDLAQILRYCIRESPEKDIFLEITRAPSYTFWNTEKTKMYQCTNHNAFLNMMEGALTGKTGFTSQAGYCYVGALEKDGKILIVSLLACGWPDNRSYKWADTRMLMKYGLENFQYREIFDSSPLGQIPVKQGEVPGSRIGEEPFISLCYGKETESMTYPLLLKENQKVQVRYELPRKLTAPVKKGQQVGKAMYFLDGELLREYPIYAREGVKKISFGWCVEKIGEKYRI